MGLSLEEKETIINFDESSADAFIFTYNRAWQRHLEKKLGLTCIVDNGYGGREYQLPKKRIKPPRAPRKISPKTRERLAAQLSRARSKNPKIGQNAHNTVKKSARVPSNTGKTLSDNPRGNYHR